MAQYEIRRLQDGTTCMTTTHLSCLPDARTLAALYGAGYVLLEDGRKTTAQRRKELMALREKGE